MFDEVFLAAYDALRRRELADRATCADPFHDWDRRLLLGAA